MTDPLQALLQGGHQSTNPLPVSSRYYFVGISATITANGNEINYLKRRFIAAPETFQVAQLYVVKQEDRLDNITTSFIGDPEQFWQIADTNTTIAPEELTAIPGSLLKIKNP